MTMHIRGLFVGCGEIARVMIDRLAAAPWFVPAGLVDVSAAALEMAGETLALGPQLRFTDLDAALTACSADAVIINTPAELHVGQAKAALLAGKHVLVAKPIGERFAQAAALVQLAGVRNLRLDVAEQMRYHRHYRALSAFIGSGALGRVQGMHFLNSKPRPRVGNLTRMAQPAILEMASHHFDLFMALFPGQPPEWIMIDGFQPAWSKYAGPCMLNGLLRLAGGLHVLYHAGYSSRASCYELRLEGERGALRCRGLHMSRPEMSYEWAAPGGDFAPIDLESAAPPGEAWSLMLDAWARALSGGDGDNIPFSGENNLKVMALMDAAIQSVESGQPCAVASSAAYRPAFQQGSEWRVAP
ncbi:MAG: Gfo/Idh/MocA family oxidoreductase [Anaerolineae bacterium]|nr:Gfo/Idh/MocA family oxidoreductase [Anaerolineae bacterium]